MASAFLSNAEVAKTVTDLTSFNADLTPLATTPPGVLTVHETVSGHLSNSLRDVERIFEEGRLTMNALLTAIVTWLSINFGLPAIYDHPDVIVTTQAQITRLRYGIDQVSDGRIVMAVYSDASHAIMLSDSWTGRTPAELSILVHEMVHHLQSKAGLKYACAGEREAPAYAAQAKWLSQLGTDLEREFSIDSMTLKIKTSCMFP